MSRNRFLSNFTKAVTALSTRRFTLSADGIPYAFENVSRRKILNACRTELSTYFRPEAPWGLPTHLMVEPSTFCNLRCALCPVTVGLERPAGNMDFALFQRVLDEIGEYLFTILLWDWGEPFLNRQIYDMIAYAKKYDVRVVSSTNGHIFENVEHADRLVRSGIDTIIFAIDGIRDQSYSAYRQGGSLVSALKGLETVVSRKRDLRSKTPRVIFRFIVMEHNENEIPELKTLARSLGADALALKTLNAASQDPYFASGEAKREQFIRFMPKNDRYRRFKIGSGRLKDLRLKRKPRAPL